MCKRLSQAAAEMLRANEIENQPAEAIPKRKKPRTKAELRFKVDVSSEVSLHIGLVHAVWWKHFRGVEEMFPGSYDDFIQVGMLALATVIRDYKPGRGAQLGTIATINIRRKMLNLVDTLKKSKVRYERGRAAWRQPTSYTDPLDAMIAREEGITSVV